MAKQLNTADRERERGDGDEALSTVIIKDVAGNIIHAGAYSGLQETEGEDTASDGEVVGTASGELYDDAIQRAFPPGNSNGDDYA